MPFSPLGISAVFQANLKQQGYVNPYPIQQAVIPLVLEGKDVLGIAQTGSGKTASFVLPILQLMQGQAPAKNREARALILVPTRELAMQILEVIQAFSIGLPRSVKSIALYGGVSINPQMIKLQGVECIVATPGRLLELLDSKAVSLQNLNYFVLDEADKMLNLGFQEEVNRILALLPKKRQNLLFSATLSEEIAHIHAAILREPVVVKIEAEEKKEHQIRLTAYSITEDKKGPLLRYLIEKNEMNQVLVFTSSVHRADAVASKLTKNGILAYAIHSKKSQGARTNALKEFKAGKVKVLVSTDLMTRGIDIQFLPYVVNYELPRSPKDFVHRVGRTGRAEASGEAISFVTEEDFHHFKVIQKKMGKIADWVDGKEFDLFGV